MRNVNIVTLRAAVSFANKSKSGRFTNLAEIQQLCIPRNPPNQGWTFFGSREVIRKCFV